MNIKDAIDYIVKDLMSKYTFKSYKDGKFKKVRLHRWDGKEFVLCEEEMKSVIEFKFESLGISPLTYHINEVMKRIKQLTYNGE